ncbi:DUF1254 domain-containing protein [Streptosporangium saharense]|uniref:hypothetical protein n=1 Tax=Streptosporangium saharense TaxID=1706840 RepID=UPI0036B92319
MSQDHRGEVDEQEYFVFVRGFFSSVESIIIRPLAGEAEPMRFRHVSDVAMNALFPTGAAYFDMLDRFVRSEPDDAVDPYMHGTLAALGIARDKAFAPSARQRELLDPAARTGWRMAKNIAANFDERDGARWWPAGPYHRAHRTGMMSSVVGMGAKYGNAYKDGDGDLLDLPPDPPAGLFWSVTVHDAETAGGRRGGAGVSVAEQHERPRLQRRRLGHHPPRSVAPGGGEELASDRPGKGVVRHVP